MNVALCPQHIDILSICAGGGGLDLGIELAIPGARSVVLVEREAFAVAQLVSAMEAGLLHQAPIWSDARTFDGLRWRGSVDGLIGGIPCQGHSLAGKKRGSLDERDLWSPARRIIVQARPWFVLIENVGGMLSPGDDDIAGAERVWRDLRKLGFAVEGGLFTASEVGASHERERIFILAVADNDEQLPEHAEPRERTAIEAEDGRRIDAGRHRPGIVSGVGQADAFSQGLEGRERRTARSRDKGATAQRDSEGVAGAPMGDAAGAGPHATALAGAHSGDEGAGARDAQPQRRGRAVGDAQGQGRWPMAERQPSADEADFDADRAGLPVADANISQLRRESSARQFEVDERHAGLGIFPPGPADASSWRSVIERAPELEPAVRRVADGLASRLDIARVDRLRMLGNGVVPLQAAYAFRTLAKRLADRGHDQLWKLCQ